MKLKSLAVVSALALLVACGTPYRATDTNTFTVSNDAQTAFVTAYPNATNVVWSAYDPTVNVIYDWELAGWAPMDVSDYVVRYDMEGENYYAWYDSDGSWVGSAYVVRDYTRLPSSIHTSIKNAYPEYTITGVNREFHKDRNVYEIEMKKSDMKVVLLVDDNGNIVKYKSKSL